MDAIRDHDMYAYAPARYETDAIVAAMIADGTHHTMAMAAHGTPTMHHAQGGQEEEEEEEEEEVPEWDAVVAGDYTSPAMGHAPTGALKDPNAYDDEGPTTTIQRTAPVLDANDIVVVPVHPRMAAHSPILPASGSRSQEHMERRRKLFSAKTFLNAHTNDNVVDDGDDNGSPSRKKRHAYKSISCNGNNPVSKLAWEDLFRPPNSANVKKENGGNGQSKAPAAKRKEGGTTNGSPSAKKKVKTKHAAPTDGTTTATTGAVQPGPKAEEVFRGPPNDELEGGWPEGWVKTEVLRRSGQYAGARDRYWYSPGGKKLRSMVEVKKFFVALSQVGGKDEEAAWKVFKTIKKD